MSTLLCGMIWPCLASLDQRLVDNHLVGGWLSIASINGSHPIVRLIPIMANASDWNSGDLLHRHLHLSRPDEFFRHGADPALDNLDPAILNSSPDSDDPNFSDAYLDLATKATQESAVDNFAAETLKLLGFNERKTTVVTRYNHLRRWQSGRTDGCVRSVSSQSKVHWPSTPVGSGPRSPLLVHHVLVVSLGQTPLRVGYWTLLPTTLSLTTPSTLESHPVWKQTATPFSLSRPSFLSQRQLQSQLEVERPKT